MINQSGDNLLCFRPWVIYSRRKSLKTGSSDILDIRDGMLLSNVKTVNKLMG